MNRVYYFSFVLVLSVVALFMFTPNTASAQPISIKEVNLDGTDIPGAQEIDDATNRLNFDTVCVPGTRFKRISIRNISAQAVSATPTLGSLLQLISKAPTWALLRDDGTSFSNPLTQIPPLLTNIPAGEKRDFQIRYAPVGPSTFDNISITLSISNPPSSRSIGGFGTAVKPQLLLVSPSSPITFPATQVGSQSTIPVTVYSYAECPVTLNDVVIRTPSGDPNPHYIILNKPTTGTVFGSVHTLQIAFRPLSPCAPEGRLIFLNSSNQSVNSEIILRGTSTGSNIKISPWNSMAVRGWVQYSVAWYLPFPTPGSFEIRNKPETGGDPACIAPGTIKRVEITQNLAEFALAASNPATPFTVAANSSQLMLVNFTPITTLTLPIRTGELKITYDNNGTDNVVYVDLIANINEGKIEFRQGQANTSTIDFGKVRLGTVSSPQTVTIVNTGTLKVNIGDPAINSDSLLFTVPFLIPTGGQPPRGIRLDEVSGSTSFKAVFAPQAQHFGRQKGEYLLEAIQGGRFKRKPYDTLFAIGTGAVPNFKRKIDTVFVGQTTINGTVSRTIKDFWTNQPGGAIQLANLFRVSIESVEITSIQPSAAASEFSFTHQSAFAIDENGTFDDTFTFKPTSGAPLVHLALVRLVYDSVGNDNKEMYFVLRGEVKAPAISSLETVIDFGEIVVGNTGTAVTPAVLLKNTGSADLMIYSPILTDLNTPKVFKLTTSEFPSSVPVDGTMLPSGLTFTPDKEGEFTAKLTMNTNAGTTGSTLTFELKGKGILPGIQSSVTEINFGRVRVGRTAVDSLRLRNTAPQTQLQIVGLLLSNPAEFTVAADRTVPFDLTNNYQSVPVTFTPQRPVGIRTDSVIINNTSQRQPAILLKGEAVLGAIEVFTTESITTAVTVVDFGSVFIQQQEQTSLSLKNTGTFDYYLTRLEITGDNADQFSLSASVPNILLVGGFPANYSIEIDAFTQQSLSFFPTSPGDKTAQLRVIGLDPVSGQPEDTTFITLRGRATNLLVKDDNNTDTLDFGRVLAGTIAVNDGVNDRYISFSNPSKNVIPVSSIVLEGQPQDVALFTLFKSTLSLPAGESDTVRVYFHPLAAMATPVTVQALVTYANGLQQRFVITGQGAAPSAQLDGVEYTTNVSLKKVSMIADVGSSSTATIVLTNTGNYDLLVSDLRWVSPVDPWLAVDALPGFSPLTLAPDESHEFILTFTPNASGLQTGKLVFTTNQVTTGAAPDSSIFTIEINAEGIYSAPPLLVTAILPLDVQAAPGNIITLPLSIQSGSLQQAGIQNMSVVLTYDGTLLMPRSVTTGPAAPGFSTSFTEITAGKVRVTLDGNGQILEQEGAVAYLACEVLLGEKTSTPLFLDTTQTVITSLLPVKLSSVQGSVILSAFCAADKRVIGVGGTVGLILSSSDPAGGFVSFIVGTPSDDPATLTIYDNVGRTIATPVNAVLPTGIHTVTVDTSTMNSGIYFAVLRVGTVVRTLQFVLQR